MSISSEITRLSGNVSAALTAIGADGVTVPSGANSDDLATLIGQIQSGGGGLQTDNIIPEQSINCTIAVGNAYAGFISTYSALPQNGEYYLVTLDGTEYIARAFYRSEGSIVLGDVRIQQGTTYTEFPFEMINEGTYFYMAVATSGAHTLKVDKILSW